MESCTLFMLSSSVYRYCSLYCSIHLGGRAAWVMDSLLSIFKASNFCGPLDTRTSHWDFLSHV